jgi:hypothetical protein
MSFAEYLDMFRHYFPGINVPAVRECFKHRATPTEYRRYLERISTV